MGPFKAGLVYFLLVFAVGWILGPIRAVATRSRSGSPAVQEIDISLTGEIEAAASAADQRVCGGDQVKSTNRAAQQLVGRHEGAPHCTRIKAEAGYSRMG
jgi:hypothetical protein